MMTRGHVKTRTAAGKSGGQAATELAVFGAILIFILGTILRSALGNSLTQNQNFNAMRMAMLASWQGAEGGSTAHNSSSVVMVQDRLSPDFNKYGDLDRTPNLANGSGSFTYQLLYPLDPDEAGPNLPIMDMYVNGQHFPFSTAAYVTKVLSPPVCAGGGPYESYPLTPAQCLQNQCLRNQREWIPAGLVPKQTGPIKLFYTLVAQGTGQFVTSTTPWSGCNYSSLNTTACKDEALFAGLKLPDSITGAMFSNDGAMEYDLLRNGDYAAVDTQFTGANALMRGYIAWQWAATAGTTPAMIGLDSANDQYPTYDIDGRLKEVTIYAISGADNGGYPLVSYEDNQGGDIDGTWDSNSCTLKPGLQNDQQIYTFTENGTYLQIKEGQLYNPETGQVVRSISKRDTIDLVQREIQLSNNTGRFCTGNSANATVEDCNNGVCTPGSIPNPVEACVDGSSGTNNCFSGSNFVKTCYDTGNNMIYVRSRLEDRRGHFWMTNATGPLQVH